MPAFFSLKGEIFQQKGVDNRKRKEPAKTFLKQKFIFKFAR
jgi:hypothetical protein